MATRGQALTQFMPGKRERHDNDVDTSFLFFRYVRRLVELFRARGVSMLQ